eukprot:1039137-Alexandrium_andersonii.AAC.1
MLGAPHFARRPRRPKLQLQTTRWPTSRAGRNSAWKRLRSQQAHRARRPCPGLGTRRTLGPR